MRHCGFFCCLLLLPVLLAPVPVPGQPGKAVLTVKELRTILEDARKKHDVPALAAGIVRSSGEPIIAVMGVRKRGTDTPATEDDLWHLGSNTKPMTSLLLALLVEMGLLDWDTPLAQLFPDLAGDWDADLKTVTPTQLLTHTSGLPANWPFSWLLIEGQGTPANQRIGMMQALGKLKREHAPGAKYQYSNLGYTVLGAIIDRAGKAPWEELMAKSVFQPLGMKHIGFGPTGKLDGPLLQPWPHYQSGTPLAGPIYDNPAIMNPAGRAHMPIADYCRFLAEVLRLTRGGKGLLQPATVQKFFTNPHPPSDHSLSGWVGFRAAPGAKGLTLRHDGSNGFNYCTALILPEDNLAVSVCANQSGAGQKACVEVRKLLVERIKK